MTSNVGGSTINLKELYKSNQNKVFLVAGLLILVVIITTLGFTSKWGCGGEDDEIAGDNAVLEVEEEDPASVKSSTTATASSNVQGCQDSDSTSTFDMNQLFTKSSTTYTTKNTTKTVEDRCHTYPNGKTYLLEGICKDGKYMWWQKNCGELEKQLKDGKYECIDGTCVNTTAINQEPKVLNNLVTELINYAPNIPDKNYNRDYSFKTFFFERENDGWIYIRIDGNSNPLKDGDKIQITIDDAAKENAVLDTSKIETFNTYYTNSWETMRYVSAGKHKARLWTSGTPSINVTIRSIPALILDLVQFMNPVFKDPYILSLIKYLNPLDWNQLKKTGILYSVNTINNEYWVIKSDEENKKHNESYIPYINEWRKKGGKWLANVVNKPNWYQCKGYEGSKIDSSCPSHEVIAKEMKDYWGKIIDNPNYDGIMVDEMRYAQTFQDFYPVVVDFANYIKSKNKLFYPYTGYECHYDEFNYLVSNLFNLGFKVVPEHYWDEDWTEKIFDDHWNDYLNKDYIPCKKEYGENNGYNYTKNSIIQFGTANYINAMPRGGVTYDQRPEVNFFSHLDKEMNKVATIPSYDGLYGVCNYLLSYSSTIGISWLAKLLRHYALEGNTSKLTTDSYNAYHIINGGFEDAIAYNGWQIQKDSPSVSILEADKNTAGNYIWASYKDSLGFKSSNPDFPERFKLLNTVRSCTKPNVFSQQINSLIPGRYYSLIFFNIDRKNYSNKAKYDNFIDKNELLKISVKIDNVQIIKSLDDVPFYGNGEITDKADNAIPNYYVHTHRRIFKANSETANLTLSDWVNPSGSGCTNGEEDGQEIVWDFIEITPIPEALSGESFKEMY